MNLIFAMANKIINYLFIMLYYLLRPLLGPAQCRFSVSCGNYAIKQLQEQPLLTALKAIGKRLWSCTPWRAIIGEDPSKL